MTAFVEDESVLSRQARAADEILSYGPDADHVVEVWRPTAAPRDTLALLVHGGYWRPATDRTHLRSAAAALADLGWTAASVEYRRIPHDPDTTLGDVQLAAQAVPQLVAPDLDVVTVGHSAGGHLVLWLATAAPPARLRGTLALAPVADLRLAEHLGLGHGAVRAFLGGAAEQRSDVDPTVLPGPRTAVTLLQGDSDVIVPPSVTHSYVRQHPNTRLVPLTATGHFALIDPLAPAWTTVTEELDRLAR